MRLKNSFASLIHLEKIFKEREQRNGIQTKPITSKFSYSENRFVPLINRNPCHESGGNPQLFPNNSVNVPRRTQSPLHTLNAESWLGGSCTPLEEALVEQCIRLGMPRKNNSKNLESNNIKMPATAHDDFDKGISMSSHLSRSRIVPDTEKERNSSKKQERFVCNSGRRHTSKRKKPKESCKRCKKCRDKSKADHVKS